MVPGLCLKVCFISLAYQLITIGLQTIPSVFTFCRSSSPFPSASSFYKGVHVTVSLLAANVPDTKLHLHCFSPLLLEAVLDFGAAWS